MPVGHQTCECLFTVDGCVENEGCFNQSSVPLLIFPEGLERDLVPDPNG